MDAPAIRRQPGIRWADDEEDDPSFTSPRKPLRPRRQAAERVTETSNRFTSLTPGAEQAGGASPLERDHSSGPSSSPQLVP